jgi:glucosylceramidase
VYNAAFVTPSGKKVLIAVNESANNVSFNIKFNGKWATVSIPGGAAATYVW